MPREYFLNIDNLSEAQAEKLEVVAVSYCWIDSSHPDPQCYHLRTLCGLLEKFVTGTFIASKTCTSMGKTFVANGNEVLGSGDGRPVGLFLEWMSVPPAAPQRCRRQGLRTRPSQHQSVVRPVCHNNLDAHVAAVRSHARQLWRQRLATFERQVAGLISPSAQLLDISSDVRDKLSASGFRNDDYYQVSLIMDKLRGTPVNPKSFAVTQIDYRGRQVDNEKFRDIMAMFQQHSNVDRIEYIDFSLTELCVSMEDVVNLAKVFINLKTLIL